MQAQMNYFKLLGDGAIKKDPAPGYAIPPNDPFGLGVSPMYMPSIPFKKYG